MLKKDIRIQYKEKRSSLTAEMIENDSLLIGNQLLKLPLWHYTYYHLFLTIPRLKEVQTETILHVLFAKNKEVVVSKSDFETNMMFHFLLTENTVLKENDWGIPEPQSGLPVPTEMIEVVFVPLLAFDLKGNRVGYGKGFYDQFLQKCKSNVVKIGLSFFEAEAIIEDVFENDIPLDFCVTPNKIYDFR